ncbi:Signal transduction histidine kinase [Actinacidiphila rubida]|uniref:histidine kinase n=2 Tax=Actinacidiphila rubida TaxID=310780 RepID=A0A1H8PD44_9ACTN|nr:Signal transduction histidine kinase [Actinacidiphila rubida]
MPAGTPQRPTRWAWAADTVLAVFLAAGTVSATGRGQQPVGFAPPFRPAGVPVPPRPPTVPLPHHIPAPVGPLFDVRAITPPWWLLVLAVLTAAPLVVRRRLPLTALCLVAGTTVVYHLGEVPGTGGDDAAFFTFASCLVAAYSAAMYSRNRRALTWCLAVATVLVIGFYKRTLPDFTPGFVPFLMLVPVGLAANTLHSWRQRFAVMESEQRAATRQAVEEERARIARELHDVVTHNVSMMTVQAGAARKVMDSAPDQAKEALLAVEAGGRAALSELRHVMGLLTMTDDVDLAPQPGLDQVGVLAGRIRDTGVPVELVVEGTAAALPPGVDLAAYRVVQEALTNTVKHAVGASVTITVRHLPEELRIEVADTGGERSPAAATGNARGLIGLRERLAVYGGTLEAGRRITGGYRVRAVIPVGGV